MHTRALTVQSFNVYCTVRFPNCHNKRIRENSRKDTTYSIIEWKKKKNCNRVSKDFFFLSLVLKWCCLFDIVASLRFEIELKRKGRKEGNDVDDDIFSEGECIYKRLLLLLLDRSGGSRPYWTTRLSLPPKGVSQSSFGLQFGSGAHKHQKGLALLLVYSKKIKKKRERNEQRESECNHASKSSVIAFLSDKSSKYPINFDGNQKFLTLTDGALEV